MEEKKSPLTPTFSEVEIKTKGEPERIMGFDSPEKRNNSAKNCLLYCLFPAFIFIMTFAAVYCVMANESKPAKVIKLERHQSEAGPFVQHKYTENTLTPDTKNNINLEVTINGETAVKGNFGANENLTDIYINIAKPEEEFKFLNDLTNQIVNNDVKFGSVQWNQPKDSGKPLVKIIDTYEVRKIPLSSSPSMIKPNKDYSYIDDILDSIFGFGGEKDKTNRPKTTTNFNELKNIKNDKKISGTQRPNYDEKHVFPHSIFKDFDNVFDIILDNKLPQSDVKTYGDEHVQKPAKLESMVPMFDVVTFNDKPFYNSYKNSYESKESDESINRFINSFFGFPPKTKTKWSGKDSREKYDNKNVYKSFDQEIPNVVLYSSSFVRPCNAPGGKCELNRKPDQNSNEKVFSSSVGSEESKEYPTTTTTEVPTTQAPTTGKQAVSPPLFSPTTNKLSSTSVENTSY